jgi:hypothetical protein
MTWQILAFDEKSTFDFSGFIASEFEEIYGKLRKPARVRRVRATH